MSEHISPAPQRCGAPAFYPDAGLPVHAGLGLKPEHFRQILETLPELGFFEVHAENYMVDGGPFHHYLTRIREHYPLSIHGVGLSIGGDTALDARHLDRLARLLDRYQPASFSEHLAWASHGDVFLNDLLPLPYIEQKLERVCTHIDQVQTHLKRAMLLENPATYVEFAESTMDETVFISEVIQRSGCGLLLDINNIYVSCVNHNRDPYAYIRALPLAAVGEIHLAGFAREQDANGDLLLIDSHGSAVAEAVWQLYEYALRLVGPKATLIERDADIPPLDILLAESRQAERLLQAASNNVQIKEARA
ncbi:MAG: DUF692 domain-containing protein [Gammaproteobacteria bacterium]|jgi:uncharacterized protein (UPF0276 family)|nr:DUF692 domain-containing protein [Gammaproteobacteria bacterium]